MTSAVYRPITDSASASYESPRLPTEGSISASGRRSGSRRRRDRGGRPCRHGALGTEYRNCVRPVPPLGVLLPARIKNLKDQQLYRVEKGANGSVFAPLLTKIADLAIIEEQWDAMMRLALSLKERTAPAHVIVQRLTHSYPSDRLSKAITNLGRVIQDRIHTPMISSTPGPSVPSPNLEQPRRASCQGWANSE